jgi:hypothetical protein
MTTEDDEIIERIAIAGRRVAYHKADWSHTPENAKAQHRVVARRRLMELRAAGLVVTLAEDGR